MPAVAILGASSNRRKFGNKSVRAHAHAGWTVYPVNPRAGAIEGLPAFASLDDAPRPIDRVSVYLPPRVSLDLVPAIAAAQPKEVFLNPGAESPDLVAALRAAGLQPILACSIVNLGLSPTQFPD